MDNKERNTIIRVICMLTFTMATSIVIVTVLILQLL
jgi:hypothetical protein